MLLRREDTSSSNLRCNALVSHIPSPNSVDQDDQINMCRRYPSPKVLHKAATMMEGVRHLALRMATSPLFLFLACLFCFIFSVLFDFYLSLPFW